MTWLTALKAFIIALPDLVGLVRDFFKLIQKAFGPDPKTIRKKMGELHRKVKEAKTQKEARDVAKKINDIISGQ